MVAVLLDSELLNKTYEMSFSYSKSHVYELGLSERVNNSENRYPLVFFNLSNLSDKCIGLPSSLRRGVIRTLRIFLLPTLFLFQIYTLSALIKKIKPDLLHINNGSYPGALSARAAVIAAKLSGLNKVIMVVNNQAIGYKRYSRWPDYFIDKYIANAVNLFITGSNSAKEKLKLVLNLQDSHLRSVFNGIAPRSLTEAPAEVLERLGLKGFNGVIFGVVALLVERKGHIILLEAVKKLIVDKSFTSEFIILIEGDGPTGVNLRDYVERYRLNKFVKFIGVEKQIFNFINSIDAFILPSIADEDFPNVVLEAMMLGKPVIASRLAGIPEQVEDQVSGVLFQPGNSTELALAIEGFVVDKDIRIRMEHQSQHRFNLFFDKEKAITKYQIIYRELIGD